MKKILQILCASIICLSLHAGIIDGLKSAAYKTMRTKAGFHVSHAYNKLRHQARVTCHLVIPKAAKNLDNEITVTYLPNGNLHAIYDGKQTPLFLGSIPCSQQDFIDLQEICCNPNSTNKEIAFFTLNEQWECKTSGLTEIVKDNNVIQFNYPTKDYSSPSLTDLLTGIQDLESRDQLGVQAVFVHCKAGRGRSATMIAAYLMHLLYKTGNFVDIDQVEKYLVSLRPQVRLSNLQKETLNQFHQELQQAHDFESLCKKAFKQEGRVWSLSINNV